MSSYKTRLIVPIATVVFIVLLILGAVMGPLLKEYYIGALSDRMKKEASVIAININEIPITDSFKLQQRVEEIAENLEIRITIIDQAGKVVAETNEDPSEMDNHLQRPEIVAAKQTGEGEEIRYSETLNKRLLYYAIPLEKDGVLTGFLRLGIPIQEVTSMYKNIVIIIFISFSLAFLIIIYLISRITNELVAPIEDAQKVAKQLAKGNFSARTFESTTKETSELNRSINVLAENLDKITKTYEMQQERLETLIENMGCGLLFVNEKGYITLVNRAIKEIFHENTDLWMNKLYYDVIEHKDVVKLIQEILMTEEKKRTHLALPIGIEIRHFHVYAAPIVGTDLQSNGAVLVFHDITELKKLEQMRKDFVANVSHELKTPVTSLKGFTETLLAGAMDDRELREKFITIIAKESERLENLIHDLLELSKIEGEQFTLQVSETDLQSVTDEVFFILNNKAKAKKITLKKVITGNSVIESDELRIKQILINLVNNAIMYTPEGGEITVRLREQAETVILQVEDTGIGISKKEIPRIFERFYRVDRARSRNSGGTGLGLAIVKHLMEALKGKITVESEVGKGTTFKLLFYKQFPMEDERE